MEPSPLAKLFATGRDRRRRIRCSMWLRHRLFAALLSRLARSVVALESDPALAETARSALSVLGATT